MLARLMQSVVAAKKMWMGLLRGRHASGGGAADQLRLIKVRFEELPAVPVPVVAA